MLNAGGDMPVNSTNVDRPSLRLYLPLQVIRHVSLPRIYVNPVVKDRVAKKYQMFGCCHLFFPDLVSGTELHRVQ